MFSFVLCLIFGIFVPLPVQMTNFHYPINSNPPGQYLVDQNDSKVEELSYRLPNNTKPETYDLSLQTWIHEGNFTFTGFVKIGIRTSTTDPGSNITLHHRQLTINDVKLKLADTDENIPLNDEDRYFIAEREFLVIPIGRNLERDTKYNLEIKYQGTLRGDMGGFYRSSYDDENGQKRWLATTQFESTNARHAFPCYDEPPIKSKYTIRITHDPSYTSISNMPTINPTPTINSDGTVTTEFRQTPPTSPYLIAFVVSDFQFTTNVNETNDGQVFPLRVWSKSSNVHETYLALDAGEKILKAISDYVDMPFSLPKMDQIAVPDFAPGAMENWGLVTYRENRLFWNENVSTHTIQRSIVSVIAHEFGHQWFGNLVGPRWWTYLWLNEGFATLFEYIGTHLVYPNWNYLDFIVLTAMQNVFQRDQLTNTAPMTDYIPNPDAMSGEFSTVSYNKAGCVLWMFLNAFSEKSFKKGLNYYLKERAFQDAAEEDLFDALDKAVKEDKTLPSYYNVHDIMKSWTRQKGYPILNVQRDYENSDYVHIDQIRYLENASEDDSTIWWIPFNFLTANDDKSFGKTTFADHWLPIKKSNISQTDQRKWSNDDWIIINKGHTGYYRVKYDDSNYELIAKGLQSPNYRQIPLLSRAQIIDDAFSFVETGRLDLGIALNLTRYLYREWEYGPWATAIKGLSMINRLFAANESYPVFEEYLRNLSSPLIIHTGIDDLSYESIQPKYLRNIAISLACSTGSEYCLSTTYIKLLYILEIDSDFHQNILATSYCGGLKSANAEIYYKVWDRLNKSSSESYRDSLISALGCSKSDVLLKEFLQASIESTYSLQEKQQILMSVLLNGQLGLNITLDFIKENMDRIYTTFKDKRNLMDDVLIEIGYHVVSQNVFEKFSELLKSLREKDYITNDVQKDALSKYDINLKWLEKHSDSIHNWLGIDSGATHFNISWLTIIYVLFHLLLKLI